MYVSKPRMRLEEGRAGELILKAIRKVTDQWRTELSFQMYPE
jgi:hypothetical protein